jgi:conjugal transfer ATP-binding protein TraC
MTPYEQQETLVRLFGVVNAYDEESGLFHVSPDRLGFGVLTSPLSGLDAAMTESLNGVLNLHWPTGTILQFSFYASPDIEEELHRFRAMRHGIEHPLLKEITRKRGQFLRKLTRQPIGKVTSAKLRNMQVLITAQIPVGTEPPSADLMHEIKDLQNSFHSALKAARIQAKPLTPQRYIRVMETLLNHGPNAMWRSSPWGSYDDSTLICNQLLDPETSLERDKRRLRLGEHCVVRTLHPKQYPDHVWPGMAMRFVGDLMRGSRSVRDPFLVTLNIIYPDHESKRGALQRDFTWTQRQTEGPLSRYIQDWALKRDSLRSTLDCVENGDRIVRAYLGVAVLAENDDRCVQGSQELQSLFREIGFRMMEDVFFVQELFTQLLPFGAEKAMEKASNRYRTLATRQVVPLLPILGSWSGTGTPLLTLFGRDGNLMTLSPQDTDGNMNIICAAQSGMGKSYLANELVMNFLSIGGRAWIIDKGFSYKPLTGLVDGTYIEFDKESTLCMNPFTLITSYEDESDMVTSILEVMAAPRAGLTDFQAAAIKKIVGEIWFEKGRNALIDDVRDRLMLWNDERVTDLGHQLGSFCKGGDFGRFFHGANNVDLTNRLVVLELQQLAGRAHLQRVILLQLMFQIQSAMDTLPREMPKILLIDEAFSLIASNETAAFIVSFYRQLRKFGATCCLCTQSVNDLYATTGAAAIVENSAHMWLLGQKPESIRMVRKEGRLEMPDAAFQLLESVHTVPGEYSEILVRSPGGIGVGRLVVSPFNHMLFTTKAQDVAQRKALMDRGMSIEQAVNAMLNEPDADSAEAA